MGEALEWIHQHPTDSAIIYEICSNSYYGIDTVDVMPGGDSSRNRNGSLIKWAHDKLVLSRGVRVIQFRNVKEHRTDTRDRSKNRNVDKAADQGRPINLKSSLCNSISRLT